jgi:hypothetical protein
MANMFISILLQLAGATKNNLEVWIRFLDLLAFASPPLEKFTMTRVFFYVHTPAT